MTHFLALLELRLWNSNGSTCSSRPMTSWCDRWYRHVANPVDTLEWRMWVLPHLQDREGDRMRGVARLSTYFYLYIQFQTRLIASFLLEVNTLCVNSLKVYYNVKLYKRSYQILVTNILLRSNMWQHC